MQAAKEAVKDFMHPNRSPHPTTDTAGSRVDPSGTSNRVDTSGNSRLDPSGTARVDMTGASKADTPRSSRFDPSGTSRFDTSRLDVPSGRPKRVEETIINPVIRNRKSDTEVREIVNPAITKETVIEENREQKVTAVDRELHQDHYQTRVQPVIDKKVLPEEHVHRTVPVEYREHKHNKREEIRRALEEERSRFQSTREVLPTKHIVESGETVVGEHHHHHVYEIVQPVIEREIIQPTVTHTTIPIHERIEKEPSFHPKTIQPVMTMEEFIRAGGTIEGRAERMDIFEGEPQVTENGGADITHPNARDMRGHHMDRTGTGVSGAGTCGSGVTTTTTSTRKLEGPLRTASPLTASERERIMQGTGGRTRSPLASQGSHSAGHNSVV